jgi:hypothetical protein
LYRQIKETVNSKTIAHMHYASVNLIRHKKLQGLAERFASSVILCPSNQSLLDEGGGERT